MIEAKEVIQIDATVIAGLLILLTIISIGEEGPSIEELKEQLKNETEKFEQAINYYKEEIPLLEQELTDKEEKIKLKAQEIIKLLDPGEIRKKLDKLELEIEAIKQDISDQGGQASSKQLSKIIDLEREDRKLLYLLWGWSDEKILPLIEERLQLDTDAINLESKINELKKEYEINNKTSLASINALNEQITSEESDFLKTPNEWIYYVGSAFTISAIFAIFSAVGERSNHTRYTQILLVLSLMAMAAGLTYLTIIFAAIGGII